MISSYFSSPLTVHLLEVQQAVIAKVPVQHRFQVWENQRKEEFVPP